MRVMLAQVSLLPEILTKKLSSWRLPLLAAHNGFQGVEWLDRLLPSLEREQLRRLGSLSRQAGLGPGALSLSIPYNASPGRLASYQTRRCLGLLEACPDLGVAVVRVALARGGLSVNHLLESVAGLRPPGLRQRNPLGLLGRMAYLTLTRAGYARDQGHAVTPPPAPREELERAARALLPLAQRAQELGLALGVENHWGLSGHPDDLLYTIGRLSNYNVGICLDLGNFYQDQDGLAVVEALAGSTLHLHYKARALDVQGEAKGLSYERRLGLLRDRGYTGAFSIEYEGPPPGMTGARRAAEVLRSLWEKPTV